MAAQSVLHRRVVHVVRARKTGSAITARKAVKIVRAAKVARAISESRGANARLAVVRVVVQLPELREAIRKLNQTPGILREIALAGLIQPARIALAAELTNAVDVAGRS